MKRLAVRLRRGSRAVRAAGAWTGHLFSLPSAWLHALRTCFTAMLALYLAYLFQLDNASSAAVTVLIVAHPVHGMAWSKGFYRALGTVIGGIMAILLADLFAQTPQLYLLAFSAWVALCMMLATLIRNFRAYAALLAGYTVGLVSLPGVELAPDTMFQLVVNRVSVVLLGIFCSAVIGSLTSRRTAGEMLERRLRQVLADLVRMAGRVLGSQVPPQAETIAVARRLRSEVAQIDSLVEFAAAESMERGYRVDERRAAALAMFSALTAMAGAEDALKETSCGEGEMAILRDDLLVELHLLEGVLESGGQTQIRERQQSLADLGERLLGSLPDEDFSQLRLRDRLSELIDDLTAALGGLVPATGAIVTRREGYLAYHLDWRQSSLNGIRAMLSVWLTGAVWLVSGWSMGGMMVGAVIPNVVLLSARDRPDKDAVEFVKGTSLASLAVFLELLLVLPNIDGFPLLMLAIAPLIAVGIYVGSRPNTAFLGLGFLVFFLTLMQPGNPMHYDMVSFLNQVPAIVGGAMFTAIIHRVILPGDPRRQARALVEDILRDLAALLRARRPVPPLVWESRLQDRLVRLGGRFRAAGINPEGWARGGFAALRLGREIIRLRNLVEPMTVAPDAQRLLSSAIARWRQADLAPETSAMTAVDTADAMRALMAEYPAAVASRLAQASNSLIEIGMLLQRERLFFGVGRRVARGS